MAGRATQVLRLRGEIVLDWGNGIRLRISPLDATTARGRPAGRARRVGASPGGTRGRKPSPATQALREAMEQDHAAGRMRDRGEYMDVLRAGGHKSSPTSANLILAREAKRIFGKPLPRGGGAGGRGPGRQPSHATSLLRERLAHDKAKGKVKDAAGYLKWLVDQEGVKGGLRQLRPMVYRELRAAQ